MRRRTHCWRGFGLAGGLHLSAQGGHAARSATSLGSCSPLSPLSACLTRLPQPWAGRTRKRRTTERVRHKGNRPHCYGQVAEAGGRQKHEHCPALSAPHLAVSSLSVPCRGSTVEDAPTTADSMKMQMLPPEKLTAAEGVLCPPGEGDRRTGRDVRPPAAVAVAGARAQLNTGAVLYRSISCARRGILEARWRLGT